MKPEELDKLGHAAMEDMNGDIPMLVEEIVRRLQCFSSTGRLVDHDPTLFALLAIGLVKTHCESLIELAVEDDVEKPKLKLVTTEGESSAEIDKYHILRITNGVMDNISIVIGGLNEFYARMNESDGIDVEIQGAIEALGVAHGFLNAANAKVKR